jgi:hypothetical protein
MEIDLAPIKAALADLTDGELIALIDATKNVPRAAPGLVAWLEVACDWELNRRRRIDEELQPLAAAAPPEEDAIVVDGTMAIRYMFGMGAQRVHALLDALMGQEAHWERRSL